MRLNESPEMCAICCEDVSVCRAVRLECSHGWYCVDCVVKHAESGLSTGVVNVACPECSVRIPEHDLRAIVPEALLERLHVRSLEQAVSVSADMWACPTPDCPMRVALDEGDIPRLVCTICKISSCLKCGAQPFHKGSTCEEFAQAQAAGGSSGSRGSKRSRRSSLGEDTDSLMRWIEATGTKQCPTCRMAVTKQNLDNQHTQYSECHKMRCRNCRTCFCFKCLAILTHSYTCGCSIDGHGFVDPFTGRRVEHLHRGRGRPTKS